MYIVACNNCEDFFPPSSCIEKWLLNCPKCPQCNAKSKRSDIRVIYAKAISAVDTTERDRALLDLENEKNARISTQKAEAQAVLQYQLVRAECDRLKLEIKSLKEQLENFSSAANCETSGGSKDVEIVGISHDKQGQYELYKSISISQVKGGVMVHVRTCSRKWYMYMYTLMQLRIHNNYTCAMSEN